MCNIDNLYSSLFKHYFALNNQMCQLNKHNSLLKEKFSTYQITTPPVLAKLEADEPVFFLIIVVMQMEIKSLDYHLNELINNFKKLKDFRQKEEKQVKHTEPSKETKGGDNYSKN